MKNLNFYILFLFIGLIISTSAYAAPMAGPVTMSAKAQHNDAGRVIVTGETNLPDQTKIMVSLSNESIGLHATVKAKISGNMFTAGPVGPLDGLANGDYLIEVSMPLAEVQPKSVQSVIGNEGQHLKGPLVQEGFLGPVVEKSFIYSVTGSAKKTPPIITEATIEPYRLRGRDLYTQLLKLKKDNKFLQLGFGDAKSKRWYQAAMQLEKDCNSESKKFPVSLRVRSGLFNVCVASNYLHQIGLRYAKHRGTDDKFSMSIKEEVKAAFMVAQ